VPAHVNCARNYPFCLLQFVFFSKINPPPGVFFAASSFSTPHDTVGVCFVHLLQIFYELFMHFLSLSMWNDRWTWMREAGGQVIATS
jgi:hypothetical protein